MGGGGTTGVLQGLLITAATVHGPGTTAAIAMATSADVGEKEQQQVVVGGNKCYQFSVCRCMFHFRIIIYINIISQHMQQWTSTQSNNNTQEEKKVSIFKHWLMSTR